MLKQEHSFVLGLFRGLLPPAQLNTDALESEESKTVEGWLYKTAPHLPVDEEGTPFLKGLKAYCVLDLRKLQLVLHSKTDGKVAEKFDLNGRLCAIDTNLIGKIDKNRIDHHVNEKRLLESLKMPQSFSVPFSLHFTDGDLVLFWASSTEELDKWQTIFEQMLTPREEEAKEEDKHWSKYCLRTRNNLYVTTLYNCLKRKKGTDQLSKDRQSVTLTENEEAKAPSTTSHDVQAESISESPARDTQESQSEKIAVPKIVKGRLFECI